MTKTEITTILSLVSTISVGGPVVAGLTFLDNRYDEKGSALKAEIYFLETQIAGVTGTIQRYNILEESGKLTIEDQIRRQVLVELREQYAEERKYRQDRL